MNALGMIIDISHVSDATMRDVFAKTAAPVMFSHSNARAICDHPRNVPDDLLLELKRNQGIIMINFYPGFVSCQSNATISDVADHMDHIKQVCGVSCLGLGADFDGTGGEHTTGLDDVSTYPRLLAELLSRGWTVEELKLVMFDNAVRVLEDVERVAQQLPSAFHFETMVYPNSTHLQQTCRTQEDTDLDEEDDDES